MEETVFDQKVRKKGHRNEIMGIPNDMIPFSRGIGEVS